MYHAAVINIQNDTTSFHAWADVAFRAYFVRLVQSWGGKYRVIVWQSTYGEGN
jgi:hypothetical protein